MEKNGFTSYQLAKQSGVSLSTLLSMFEHNTQPRVETIEKLCSACNISIAQFFERSSTNLPLGQKWNLYLFNTLTPKGKDMARSYLRFLTEND